MSNTMKLKVGKFINIMFMLVVGVLIALASFIIIGSEIGFPKALALNEWLQVNYGVAVSTGSVTIIIIVAKQIISIRNNNDKTVTAVNAALEQMELLKNNIIQSNKETQEKIDAVNNEIKQSIISMQAQPERINNINSKTNDNSEKLDVIFDMLDLFMYKNTNDQTIKDIMAKYKQTRLFSNAQEKETQEKETQEKAETVVGQVASFANKAIEIANNAEARQAVRRVIDTGSNIIKEIKRK